jgi:hypothetical protein
MVAFSVSQHLKTTCRTMSQRPQHEELAAPAREQVLEHRDRPLTGVGAARDLGVDRQRTEQRHQDGTDVASGATVPATRRAMPGWSPRVEK